MDEAKKIDVLTMLEDKPGLLELLEVAHALPADKKESLIRLAVDMLLGNSVQK